MSSISEAGTSRSFQYDFLDRLTASPGWLAYAYDASGNRTWEDVAGVPFVHAYGATDRIRELNLPAYMGCYVDQPTRALPVQLMTSGATAESCIAAAQAKGLRYAGLQYHHQCWGGDTLQYARAPEAECNTPCTAKTSQTCGGGYRNSVYLALPSTMRRLLVGYDRQSNVSAIAQLPRPTPTSYQGCYTDQSERALPVQLMTSGATVSTCRAAARARGLTCAGLQYYGQCFGGNELRYAKVDDAECSTK